MWLILFSIPAKLSYARVSVQKACFVLDAIRGKDVTTALAVLEYNPASTFFSKLASANGPFFSDLAMIFPPVYYLIDLPSLLLTISLLDMAKGHRSQIKRERNANKDTRPSAKLSYARVSVQKACFVRKGK